MLLPLLSRNVINYLKKRKKDVSQEKHKHFTVLLSRNMLWPLSTRKAEEIGISPFWPLAGKKCVQYKPYNCIWVSAFNKVPKKERWRLPSPSSWEQVLIQNRKKQWYYYVTFVWQKTILIFWTSFLEAYKYASLLKKRSREFSESMHHSQFTVSTHFC